ncbi:MAG: polynucleotide adenylyltransferase PcnB [Pseudomonadales bacterium]|nr:polynucleotide adenylyltransferase PcnB [Pseudomonadales bacterium]
MTEISSDLSDHPISINALKVVRRLIESGFQAFLVGGCVRDLLLDATPKDFDVATDAHPEDVRDIFRNSRLVGRRFRIAHVRFGREIIEVATFRAANDAADNDSQVSDGGMLLSDNNYGTFREDAERRDFTINALYYDPEHKIIHDEVGGLTDLENRQIRLIGDPESRFREDPVRMLRAVRFKAKLGFSVAPETEKPMRRLGFLLQDVPAARLFEEVLKLTMTGYGERALEHLREYDLFGWLFPQSNRDPDHHQTFELIRLALASTDTRIQEDKPVTPAFIFAALLWHPFTNERQRLIDEGATVSDASFEAANNVIAQQLLFTSIPRRFSGPMRDIWFLQYRLPNRAGKKAETLMAHKRFRAAYDFLILREESGERLDNLGKWWTEYQEANNDQRQTMTTAAPKSKTRKRNRRKRRRPDSQ